MVSEPEIEDTAEGHGLCTSCHNARVILGANGATYSLCELSAGDETYPKYPRLPVLSCPGYLAIGEGTNP